MKIILLKDIAKVGKRYDVKDVNSGHALNFLIPKGLAVSATKEAIKRIDLEKARKAGEIKVQNELLESNIQALESATIKISGKANEQGHLFAGLHKEEIVKELSKQAHIEIDPSFVKLEHPLKEVGEHKIAVESGNKKASFKVIIEALK